MRRATRSRAGSNGEGSSGGSAGSSRWGWRIAWCVALAVASSVAGCAERGVAPSAPCVTTEIWRSRSLRSYSISLLIVIDTSTQTLEAQQALARALPAFVEGIHSGDLDGDGYREREAGPWDVRVGVITADLGAGPHDDVPGCVRGLGDDGLLSARGSACGDPRADLSRDASLQACLVTAGEGGCVLAQPLEAALLALSMSRPRHGNAVRFADAEGRPDVRSGHGDLENDGFTSNGYLAVLIVTGGDDMSLRDAALASSTAPGISEVPYALRGVRFPNALHPIERYIEGLSGVPHFPEMLVFGVLAGTPIGAGPTGAGPATTVGALDALLADPRMQPREGTPRGAEPRLVPSCRGAGVTATPPRRLVEAARGLAARDTSVVVSSICAEAPERILTPIAERLTEVLLSDRCLASGETAAPATVEGCDVYEFEQSREGPPEPCDVSRGREPVASGTDEFGTWVQCRVRQVDDASSAPGWYVTPPPDDWHCPGGLVGYTAPPRVGVETSVRCAVRRCVFDAGQRDAFP